MVNSLHAYYAAQGVSVSYRNLQSDAELAAHAAWREALYSEMLGLPPAFFRGLHVGEFGPDTGENALCFARWGARLTLAEPNAKAHAVIRAYFNRFRLDSQLLALSDATLETIDAGVRFDFINAEGFVGSIRPPELWLAAVDRLLAPQGLFLVSYFERSGAWMEQVANALARVLAHRTGLELAAAAEAVVGAKWRRIAHTRPFAAWFMDVVENPFARRAYQFDAGELLSLAAERGFRLHSSVPQYRDPLWIGWYKKSLPAAELLGRARTFIRRSRMGHVLGHQCFWAGDEAALASIDRAIDESLRLLDLAIENPGSADAAAISASIRSLVKALHRRGPGWMADRPLEGAVTGIEGLADSFAQLGKGNMEAAQKYATGDGWFLGTWGTPVHFAVFRRDAESA
jgi:SAM-dependent methyltransferase